MLPRLTNSLPWTLRFLRLLPTGMSGKTRLAKTLLRFISRKQDRVIRGQHNVSYLVPHLDEPISLYMMMDGVYEPRTCEFLLGRLKPGATFVDIGANIGVFTIPAAKRVGHDGRVLALEVSPRIFSYLQHNVDVNQLSNVFLSCCAVQDMNVGTVSFYDAPVSHFGMGSLSPQFGALPIEVPARTLDSLLAEFTLQEVNLLKVDVEGFEAAVFRGSRNLLTGKRPPVIVFEFCDWAERRALGTTGEAQRELTKLGYRLWRLEDALEGRPALRNVLRSGSAMIVGLPAGTEPNRRMRAVR